ncbi:2',5'-phosphodiesterase 12 [Culicoides brevitarsis]|uniref:2',5'-phosphodiesterase 12 n=1 Tax=Culicoides brevitarsis TaxID=469753 RepID=UPI00307B8897
MLTRLNFISRRFSKAAHKLLFDMEKAYFKKAPDNRCNITFRYTNDVHKIDRVFNFSRDINEKVVVALDRIKVNVEKELNKKLNKQKNKKKAKPEELKELPPPIDVEVTLLRNQEALKDVAFSELLSFEDINSESLYSLKILENNYNVVFNCPWVTEVKMPTSILANYFVYPSRLLLEYADTDKSEIIWYKGLPKDDEEKIEWQQIGTGFTYLATSADIGYKLKVVVVPKNAEREGPAAEAISKCEVQADPGSCPFDTRHLFTQDRCSGTKFRVVSYNLLADLYADSETAKKELFPYCPEYALNIDYRKQLFMKELIGYNADLMCTQETDDKIFDLDLKPVFANRGMDGTFQAKGVTREGLATFWNKNRFELVEKHGMNIGEKVEKLPEFAHIWDNVKTNKALWTRLVERSTALQVTLLRVKDSNKLLLVANTHLYFHPDADHIRLLQIGLSMLFIENYRKELKTRFPNDQIALVFCGDFNSVPECGIYKLMTEKFVPQDFIDWNSNEEQAVKGLELRQPFDMKSAYSPELAFTNFTPHFTATLDYIFYESDKLEVNEVIPTPSAEELHPHVAIPSIVCPSDHVALVANLDWK